MKHLYRMTVILLIIGFAAGCNEQQPVAPKANSTEVENTEDANTSNVFISPEHEADYNAYINGALSVDDLKRKYQLEEFGLSDADWDLIFRGQMDVTSYDRPVADEDPAKLFSNRLMKKVVYDRSAELQQQYRFEDIIAKNAEKRNEETKFKAGTLKVTNKHYGNMLWYCGVEMLLSASTVQKYNVRDVNYADVIYTPPPGPYANFSRQYVFEFYSGIYPLQFNVSSSRVWSDTQFTNSYYGGAIIHYTAWFNFFWITYQIYPQI